MSEFKRKTKLPTSACDWSYRSRHGRSDSCSLIEHYTDVVAEAVTAEAIAYEAGDRALATRANKLASTATHAQRGAVAACRRGVRVR